MDGLFSGVQRADVVEGVVIGFVAWILCCISGAIGRRYQQRYLTRTPPAPGERVFVRLFRWLFRYIPHLSWHRIFRFSFATGLGAFLVALLITTLQEEEVAIASPRSDTRITVELQDTPWFGDYEVMGTSKGVEDNHDLRVYVLSRRTEPPLPDWYVAGPAQPAEGDGAWKIVLTDGWDRSPARAGIE